MAQICALARYTILARLLGPEQLGLAATLILTAQFFESLSENGSDRFLIQDKQGDEPDVQKLVQLVFVSRGLFTALALIVFSIPLSWLYKTPQLAPGFVLLAASPLIAGLLHLDLRRNQRVHDFRSEGAAMLASELVSLLATAAAAYVFRNFTAVAFGLIVRSLVMVLVSHLRAERPYRIGYSAIHAKRLAPFAAPLMVNGILLFSGSQGDRVLVGNQLGVSQLGHYSAVLLLIYYPTAVIMRFMAGTHLPRVAKDRERALEPGRSYDIMGGQFILMAILIVIGFATVGPIATVVLYGHKFAQSSLVVGLIGILQTGRFIRQWPNTVALGMGRSSVPLATNIVRLVALPIAVVGVKTIGGLPGICVGFAVGELLALALGLHMLNRAVGAPFWRGFDRLGMLVSTYAITAGWTMALGSPQPVAIAVLLCVSVALAIWVVRRERSTLQTALNTAARLLRIPASVPC